MDFGDYLFDLDSPESEQEGMSPEVTSQVEGSSDKTAAASAEKRIIRRRARRACLECRKRKVRCDLLVQGQLCTNCRLDGQPCTVSVTDRRRRQSTVPIPLAVDPPDDDVETPLLGSNLAFDRSATPFGHLSKPSLPYKRFPHKSLSTEVLDNDVLFSYYGFLETEPMTHMPVEDFKFLEMKGCFHLPSKNILDEFVSEYFLHVHPMLPILDEGAFWDMYERNSHLPSQNKKISLFLFRAMLFVASSFVSLDTLKSLGFENTWEARISFYRRVKFLYDFDTTTDSLAIAQGALLLTYYSSDREPLANTSWLRIAIQYAQAKRAHLHYQQTSLTINARQELKRLWWCCILRDRILPLGVRRPIHITRDNFDFDREPLSEDDLANEFENSRVYENRTKRILAAILGRQVALATILTDVLSIVFPVGELDYNALKNMPAAIKRCRDALVEWKNTSDKSLPDCDFYGSGHPSISLFSGLTNIYSESARAALCQFECLALHANTPNSNRGRIRELGNELYLSIARISSIMGALVHQNVAQYLPVTMVAYLALPIVLNTIDLRSTRTKNTVKNTQLRLSNHAMQICRSKYTGSDVAVDTINRAIASMNMRTPTSSLAFHQAALPTTNVSTTQLTKTLQFPQAPSTIEFNDWLTVFVRSPRTFLRLAFTLDISLSRGRYAAAEELPRLLLLEEGADASVSEVPKSLGPLDLEFAELFDEEDVTGQRLDLDFFDFGGR